ncbi:MAG: hypothetical protein ACXVA9_10660 [Bdellovibrionales bacterium]
MSKWLLLFLIATPVFAQPNPYGVWSGQWNCQGMVNGNKGSVKCSLNPLSVTADPVHFTTQSTLVCPENPETTGGLNLNYTVQGSKVFDAGHEVGYISNQVVYATIDVAANPFVTIYEFDLDKTGRNFSYLSSYQDKTTGRRMVGAQFACQRL